MALIKPKRTHWLQLGSLSAAICVIIAVTGCASTKPEAFLKPGEKQMPKQFTFHTNHTTRLSYLLFLPAEYGKTDKRWPVMLFLHGAGERGSDISKVMVHGPPKIVNQRPDFPFIVVSPQCPNGQHWSNEILLALLNDVEQHYAVDRGRIYVTGLSMGGYGTWDLGMTYPERFAAIAPICGGGQMITLLMKSREKPQDLKTLGVWAFHGAKDPTVPLEESQRMVDALKKVGAQDVKLTVYPEAGHDSWTQAYNDPELYDWLLKHDRQAR